MVTSSRNPGNHVCVVGAGTFGLNAAKNLLEQGLEVTVFERWGYIGGNWHPSANTDQTAALDLTTKNTSKQASSFTDFPYQSYAGTHPSAAHVQEYLELYAQKFDLIPHVKLNTEAVKVERNEELNKWTVSTRDLTVGPDGPVTDHLFDRVVVVTGMLNVPNLPKYKGSELFEGEIIHSRQFRNAEKYKGKNVIVVGVGASATDTQSFLVTAGAKVYLSHRDSFIVLPRMQNGKAFDHTLTHRMGLILRTLASWAPVVMSRLMTKGMTAMMFKEYPGLKTHPSFAKPRILQGVPHRVPNFDNNLAQNLVSDAIQTCQGIEAFTGPRSVRLLDGTVLEDIDAVIVCSGYRYDFSLIHGAGSPTDPEKAPDGFERMRKSKFANSHSYFPRLYHGYISEQFPESLAFIGTMLFLKPPFVVSDLETMALASVWSGQWPVPSAGEMARDIDAHYDFVVTMLKYGPMPHPGFRWSRGRATYRWMNEVAGTGVNEKLAAWGVEGWKFWWRDRKFYNLVMNGIDTPYVYRLFDTGRGRKAWAGAREAIERANREVEAMGEKWKKEEEAKKQR
ncbi:FAD/NAD(P)-binding domain-containing protein [Coniochaeta sp. PMI_546]|nr:FAD/NAD(P)-binding domain-containing protein [Coniochaeta sp. PMI_546]